MASMSAAPGTPPRTGRTLRPRNSEPKTDLNSSKRRRTEAPDVKVIKQEPLEVQEQVHAVSSRPRPEWKWDSSAEFDKHGVKPSTRPRLQQFIQKWGPARIPQALGLWTHLGDGCSRPVSVPTLQVWGQSGSGKSSMVFSYLEEFGITHVRLNCATFMSIGELHARIAEELRIVALAGATKSDTAFKSAPPKELKELQQKPRMGRQIRAIDRLEASIRLPLEYLKPVVKDDKAVESPSKVVIVLDHAQELPRLGADALDHLVALPEVLKMGSRLAIVTISRLPLSSLGVLPARDPVAVAFRPYSEAEASTILFSSLATVPSKLPEADLKTICGSGLMKCAAPYVGGNLYDLLRIGENMVAGRPGQEPIEKVENMLALQQRIQDEAQRRAGLCDLSGVLGNEPSTGVVNPATTATMRGMTKAEKRLLLAAYLGARIDKDDDVQLFLPEGKRRQRKKGAATKDADDEFPAFVRAPRPMPLSRLLAIYHRLARQPLLVGPILLEHLTNLREAGFLRFPPDHCIEREPKVVCRVELPLARACANELDIDLAEYLCR